jgi:Cu/Ag efflux protein CusF
MKSFVFAVFATVAILLSLAFSAHAHEGHLPQVDGVIRKLDKASGSITITHGEIPNLNMGAMTMSFKAKNPALLKPWKEGDKIRFRVADVKGVLTVFSIEAAK